MTFGAGEIKARVGLRIDGRELLHNFVFHVLRQLFRRHGLALAARIGYAAGEQLPPAGGKFQSGTPRNVLGIGRAIAHFVVLHRERSLEIACRFPSRIARHSERSNRYRQLQRLATRRARRHDREFRTERPFAQLQQIGVSAADAEAC